LHHNLRGRPKKTSTQNGEKLTIPYPKNVRTYFRKPPALTLFLTSSLNRNPKAQQRFQTDEMTSFFEKVYRFQINDECRLQRPNLRFH